MAVYFALIIALVEISTPILIQSGWVPAETRWISHAINLFLVLLVAFRAIRGNTRLFLVGFVLFFTVIGGLIAVMGGQGTLPTLWGWWSLFRYPFIGFAVYLDNRRSRFRISTFKKCILILWLVEISIQCVQYAAGTPVGDSLASSFGAHGTGYLLLLELVLLSVFFGEWIVTQKTNRLILPVLMGLVSSLLGEMKLFFFALGGLGLVSFLLLIARNRVNIKALTGLSVFAFALCAFPGLYNRVVVPSHPDTLSFLQQITDPKFIQTYSNFVYKDENGNYNVGRNYAVLTVWKTISTSNARLLLGDGLGSRGQSDSLGSTGIQLAQGDLGAFTGSSLVVFMGEYGILGIFGFLVFWGITLHRCYSLINKTSNLDLLTIANGLFIFTLFWPIWLWYSTTWTFPGSMALYWLLWGSVFLWSSTRQRAIIP